MDLDLVIERGTLITPGGTYIADLGIRDGKIAVIANNLSGSKIIDARDKLVIPGGVDPHVHLEMPVGQTISCDDWETGTRAAAFGGTTTLIDFVEPESGQSLMQAFHDRHMLAKERANIDFGFHMTLTPDNRISLSELSEIFEAGMTSFKMYTTYEGFRLSNTELLNNMAAVRGVGGICLIHAENDAMITWLQNKFLQTGKTNPKYHPLSRPNIAEGESIHRVLGLASIAKAPVYIVHVSTKQGAKILDEFRLHNNLVFGETCPQYLLLTDLEYAREGFEGAKFVCSPPLRGEEDQKALWYALAMGALQTVGTDHCPFNFKGQKDLGLQDFTKIPGGLPGIESRLALLYTFGVGQGRLTVNQWVEACCTNPARIFGLYPKKGALVPGADADIVIFDPQKEVTISTDTLHENVDYTPYAGYEIQGFPIITIARGKVLVKDGRYSGPKGHGRYLSRTAPNFQWRSTCG